MSAKHEWLNLLEVSGPFLAVPVLREVFPQGLEELDTSRAKRLRSAYEEWRDAVDGDDADRRQLHAAWIDEVLRTALEADDQLLQGRQGRARRRSSSCPNTTPTIAPELVVRRPDARRRGARAHPRLPARHRPLGVDEVRRARVLAGRPHGAAPARAERCRSAS